MRCHPSGGSGSGSFAHQDQPGQAAAERWTEQLKEMAKNVDQFSLQGMRKSDGEAVKDFNDLLAIDIGSYRSNRQNCQYDDAGKKGDCSCRLLLVALITRAWTVASDKV
jgi:hypothetical protein